MNHSAATPALQHSEVQGFHRLSSLHKHTHASQVFGLLAPTRHFLWIWNNPRLLSNSHSLSDEAESHISVQASPLRAHVERPAMPLRFSSRKQRCFIKYTESKFYTKSGKCDPKQEFCKHLSFWCNEEELIVCNHVCGVVCVISLV